MSLTPESEAILARLAASVEDLQWHSETDAPFELLYWPGTVGKQLAPADVLKLVGLESDTPLEVLAVEAFFAPALTPQDWHTPVEVEETQRFQALQRLLSETLTQLQVYRCGEIELEIYITGQLPTGEWAVLHTSAVET
ncbi:MAG TPA: nuclease A inhibitor family protein [Stenomitos sp.]